MKADIKEGIEKFNRAIDRHNKIFLFKYKDRIDAIKQGFKDKGISNYKYPIAKDKDGRYVWLSRKLRRKNNVR